MAMKEVAISMKKHQGKPGDGSCDGRKALASLKSKLETSPSPSPSPSCPKLKCPKVPKRLRAEVKDVKGVEDCYAPKLISLGPYYHGESRLAEGEELKLKLAEAYIQYSDYSVDAFYDKISSIITELKDCYDEMSTEKYDDDEFTVMMLVDGCALLFYILWVCLGYDHENINIRYQDISVLYRDALLLENQLPYQLVLELMKMMEFVWVNDMWTAMFQEFFGINDESIFQEFMGMESKESLLKKIMKNSSCHGGLFLWENRKSKLESAGDESESKPESDCNELESKPCHHLLDLFRRNFLGEERLSSSGSQTRNEKLEGTSSSPLPSETDKSGGEVVRASVRDVKEVMASFRNVKELMDAGIRIKRSPTRHLRDISFRSNGITACLRIPPITIDSSTKVMFLNLIAYEMSSNVPMTSSLTFVSLILSSIMLTMLGSYSPSGYSKTISALMKKWQYFSTRYRQTWNQTFMLTKT